MKLPRREFLHLAAGAAALPAVSRFAWAQAYPTRPITIIVPFPPGGTVDAVARVLAERMRGPLGQPIIIENVSGAGGSIGTGRVARARPDGYTIDLGITSTHALNGAFYSLPYDVLDDFDPMTQFTFVPYRGGAPAIQDLVAGQIDLLLMAPDALPLVRAGSIKAYAVTSDTRLALGADIPTFGEVGLPSLSYLAWWGLFAPKGTPRDIIGKLNAAAREALADPAVQSRLVDLGVDIFPRERQTPEALGALVKADAEKWWPLIKEFGIRAE